MDPLGPSPTSAQSKNSAHLARVRDNQRRSRARRKEYLQELEDKFRRCEQLGVEASAEMQAAARKVLEENQRLRAILRNKGLTDEEMDGLIVGPGETSSASTSLENMMNSKRPCGTAGPSSSSGGVPSPTASDYSPASGLGSSLPRPASTPAVTRQPSIVQGQGQWQRGSVSSVSSSQQNMVLQPPQPQPQPVQQQHQQVAQQIHPHPSHNMPAFAYANHPSDPSTYALFDMYGSLPPQQPMHHHHQQQQQQQQQHLPSSHPAAVGYHYPDNELAVYPGSESQVQVQDLLPPEVQAQFLRSLHLQGNHQGQGYPSGPSMGDGGRGGHGYGHEHGVSKMEDAWEEI